MIIYLATIYLVILLIETKYENLVLNQHL